MADFDPTICQSQALTMPDVANELDETTRRGRNVVKVLLDFCNHDTGNGTQRQLAENVNIREDTLARLHNGDRRWSEENLSKAYAYLHRFPGTGSLIVNDLLGLDSTDLVRKIVPDTQRQHALIAKLLPSQRPSPNVVALSRLIGFYVAAYLCRNPNNTEQLCVAIDSFEFRKSDHPEELYVEQSNFPHDETYLPRGRLRLRNRIIEIDVHYMEGYPDGKFLAPMPELDPNGKYNFIATMLDIKIKSRLVVSRPILFMQIDNVYLKWEVQAEGTEMFSQVVSFLQNNAQFEGSNFELCPSREARWEEWRPVISELRAILVR
jgi:hypothetical protein